MISRVLRRTQETQVLQELIAVHLDPYDFEWELVDSLEPEYDEALAALQSLQHELEDRNQSAAGSLAEGLDETLTLHRLGVYVCAGPVAEDDERPRVHQRAHSETRVPRLSHSNRRYFFLFDVRDSDGYFLVFRPGVDQEESTELVAGWLRVMPHVQAWADRVKAAVDAEHQRR